MKTIYKRKRERKTNYKKRLKLLFSGKPRLVVRKSLKNIIAQIVEYTKSGDKTLISAHTREFIKLGWKSARRNTPLAYLLGLSIANKAKKKNIKEVILDIGMSEAIKNSLSFAVLKGALDGGLKIKHSPDILPNEKRISGEHIKNFDIETFKKIKERLKS